jgi:hypothetical protein
MLWRYKEGPVHATAIADVFPPWTSAYPTPHHNDHRLESHDGRFSALIGLSPKLPRLRFAVTWPLMHYPQRAPQVSNPVNKESPI